MSKNTPDSNGKNGNGNGHGHEHEHGLEHRHGHDDLPLQEDSYYQIKISLVDSPLPIWRRVLIRADAPLSIVHQVVQITMGWFNTHLHHFEQNGKVFGDPEEAESGETIHDYNHYALSDLLVERGDEVSYIYDYGDDWKHRIVLEDIQYSDVPENAIAQCTMGKRACPPEDVGGVEGYANFISIIEDPEHEQYLDTLQWVGCDFDPNSFDPRQVNLRIQMMEERLQSLCNTVRFFF